MPSPVMQGRRTVSFDMDREGYRTYQVEYLVRSDSFDDGPAGILDASGLPAYGDSYVDNSGTVDSWATCKLDTSIKLSQERKGERGIWWDVTKTFTNKPDGKRCKALQIDNPLNVTPEVSMSFVRYTEEATADKDGNPIVNSAYEQIRGQNNEWDMCRAQVKVVQNVSDPQLDALLQMVDTVNSVTLWPTTLLPGTGSYAHNGFPPRTVKLSEAPVEWLYTEDCSPYYRRTLTFDIRYRAKVGITTVFGVGSGTSLTEQLVKDVEYDTFDRYVADEGTKALRGTWNYITNTYTVDATADPTKPQDFKRMVDKRGNPMRVMLDGHGHPADTVLLPASGTAAGTVHPIGKILIQYYGQSDFTLLSKFPVSLIPVVLGP